MTKLLDSRSLVIHRLHRETGRSLRKYIGMRVLIQSTTAIGCADHHTASGDFLTETLKRMVILKR